MLKNSQSLYPMKTPCGGATDSVEVQFMVVCWWQMFFSAPSFLSSTLGIYVWIFKIQLCHLVCIYFNLDSHCFDCYLCLFLCFLKFFFQFYLLVFYFILSHPVWVILIAFFFNHSLDFFYQSCPSNILFHLIFVSHFDSYSFDCFFFKLFS